MQEIGPNVFIETEYAGVTLGLIDTESCLVLIDAPFSVEDIRSWRAKAAIMQKNGSERFLINLDAHVDRIAGVRAMESVVVGHEALGQMLLTRPFPYRMQSQITGADWESCDNASAFRWAPPELTFRNEMTLHCGDTEVLLQETGGADQAAVWVNLPHEKILFIGDQVVLNQPPFFANASIPAWIETLHHLQNPKYDDYTLIGGRNGVIQAEDICRQIQLLEKIQEALEELKNSKASECEIEGIIPDLLKEYDGSPERLAQYRKRLQWGLSMYYLKNYFPEKIKETEGLL